MGTLVNIQTETTERKELNVFGREPVVSPEELKISYLEIADTLTSGIYYKWYARYDILPDYLRRQFEAAVDAIQEYIENAAGSGGDGNDEPAPEDQNQNKMEARPEADANSGFFGF